MNKKIGLLIILSIMFIGVRVEAASYSLTLNTATQEVVKDSVVDIYVTLDNINGIPEGINACNFNLEYDSTKIEIIKNNGNSLIGENGWNGAEGESIVWANQSTSATTKTNIGKISAKIIDNGTITIKNIECSDGNNDITTSTNSLSFTLKQEQINNEITNNQNNNSNNGTNNDYNSSGTVESPKTGVKEWTITFVLIALISLIIKKVVSKKDLFKKI